jgi:hypothetical protein
MFWRNSMRNSGTIKSVTSKGAGKPSFLRASGFVVWRNGHMKTPTGLQEETI